MNIFNNEIHHKSILQKCEYLILTVICYIYLFAFPIFFAIIIISSSGWNYVFTGKLMGLTMAVFLIMTPYMFNFVRTWMNITCQLFNNERLSLSFMKSTLGMDISTMTTVSNPITNCVGACVTNVFFVYSILVFDTSEPLNLFVMMIAQILIILPTIIFILFIVDMISTHISISPPIAHITPTSE